MPFTINRAVAAVRPAPIAEAQAWIPSQASQRLFINLCQAVPSYPPAERLMEAVEVAITAGCHQAVCAVLSAVAGPGDNVVLPLPWYFNHQMWLDLQQIA